MFDLRYRRIPNWWIATGLIAGIALTGPWFLIRALAVIALLFPLFMCRMMGAGDIKLMALIWGFMGGVAGTVCVGCGLLIGSVVSLFKLIRQKILWQRFSYFHAYIWRLFHTKELTAYYRPERDGNAVTIPLACCLFFGALIYVVTACCHSA